MSEDAKHIVAALLTQTVVEKSTDSDTRGESSTVKKTAVRVFKEILKELDEENPPKKKGGKITAW